MRTGLRKCHPRSYRNRSHASTDAKCLAHVFAAFPYQFHCQRFLEEADTDGDGKISAEEFKAFALQNPEMLVGLVRMRRILIELMQRCKKIRIRREREREESGLRGKLKPF